MNKLIIIASLFVSTFATGCLTDEKETVDPTPLSNDDGANDDTDENGCRLDKVTNELECPDPE